MKTFYDDLAAWWPLLPPVEAYEAEAHEIARALRARRPTLRSALELGCGGGH